MEAPNEMRYKMDSAASEEKSLENVDRRGRTDEKLSLLLILANILHVLKSTRYHVEGLDIGKRVVLSGHICFLLMSVVGYVLCFFPDIFHTTLDHWATEG